MNKNFESVDIIVKKDQLILSENLVAALNAAPGDKISIVYQDKNGVLIPFIQKDENGNKLNKNLTIAFRGKRRELLCEFGGNFWMVPDSNGSIELEGDGVPIYTDVKKAVEAYITKEIILDTNYNITKLNNYEF